MGTGQGYSNLEILNAVGELLGGKIDYDFADRRAGDPPALYTATDKARDVLGFETEYSDLSHIIKTAHAWHKKSPNGYSNDL